MASVLPGLTIEIKNRAEARATVERAGRARYGMLRTRGVLLLTALTGALFAVARRWARLPLALLLLDFLVYVVTRRRYLARCRAGQPRLVTPEELAAAAAQFAEAGLPEPSMTDYEEAAGISTRSWANDLRYAFTVGRYRGGVVADIGCGDGRLCWRYEITRPDLYIGVDPARDLIRTLRDKTADRARGVVGTAEATTLPDASVDLVVCSECFEHLEEPGRALREFSRILRPGGEIVIQSPSAYQIRNLNPLHVMTTWLGRLFPGVLQRTVVHENTFLRAFTYHWDFTHADFARYLRGLPLDVVLRTTATYRFNPRGSLVHRLGAMISRWPIINGLWWDMTVVLRKREV